MAKGQVSTELIIIVGLILVLFIPVLITVYLKTVEANEQITAFQSSIAVSRLANTVNSVGQLGRDAYVIAEVQLPPQVEKIAFLSLGNGGEIVMHIQQEGTLSEVAEVVRFPMEATPDEVANPSSGIYRFKITNTGDKVSIELLG